MNPLDPALIINLLGFAVGVSLYGMLLVMVFRHRTNGRVNHLLLLTAALGIVWNVGELLAFAWRDFRGVGISPFLQAASFSALGFLPAAVLHTVRKNEGFSRLLVAAAYVLSFFAAVMHFAYAAVYREAPSILAFQVLSAGALVLVAALFLRRAWQGIENRAIVVTALLVFAFSAFHLSTDSEYEWWLLEMVAHQSSLPLVIAILIQDYRFAFADLYLKRALSLLLIALTAFGAYVLALAPILDLHSTHESNDPLAVGATLLFWIGTAAAYPAVQRFSGWIVDRVLLRRVDYARFLERTFDAIDAHLDEKELVEDVTQRVGGLLAAERAKANISKEPVARPAQAVKYGPGEAKITIVTDDAPHYSIELGDFAGGRRLLSDEAAVLEKLALAAGRKIDSLRAGYERQAREARERELARLTAEARLSALRQQINPHFLFNALTTIGQLIRVAPDRAFDTLMKLTALLRRVLRNTGEFTSVEEEIGLIRNYLDIEKARFEERLSVEIRVPDDLKDAPIPSLIIQPLVENSIKHAISRNGAGGTVSVDVEARGDLLSITVRDTGSHVSAGPDAKGTGIGLENIRERLANHFGRRARLTVSILPSGSEAVVEIPLAGSGEVKSEKRRKKKGELVG